MIHKAAEESWTNAHEHNLAGQYPLHHACRDGNSVELRRLLTELQNNVSNAEILSAEDPYYNWTAGHFAAYFGNLDCLRLLMQAGSVYNSSRASSGLAPLPCPLSVLSSRCRQSLLQVAAFADHPQCVQWLLQYSPPLDQQDVNGETALHKACRSNSWECSQLLVACRADKSIRNDNGLTPAELAAKTGHQGLANHLAQLGVPETRNGFTNGTNGHTNGVHTNGTATNGFSTQTPTTSSASVNHLVSSNGYYGYHQSHGQTPSTSTTASGSGAMSSTIPAPASDMDMDEGVPPVASTSASGFGAVNLLTDDSVSRDMVPVAGKKRVREDDHLQQSKRGRFQDAPWSGVAEASTGSDSLPSQSNTPLPNPSPAGQQPTTTATTNRYSLFAGAPAVTLASSVLLQLGASACGGAADDRTQVDRTPSTLRELLSIGQQNEQGWTDPYNDVARASLFGFGGEQRLARAENADRRGRTGRSDSSGSCSDSGDSGIASSSSSMDEEALQSSMDVAESCDKASGNLLPEGGDGRCGTSGLSGCPIPAPVDLLAGRPAGTATASLPHHTFRPGHFF